MSSEIRKVIDQVLPVIDSIRDTQISLMGTTVTFRVPSDGKPEYNIYGDVISDTTPSLLTTQIIIKWGDYRTLLNTMDSSAEENLPLEVISKIRDNVPKGSEVDLTYINQDSKEIKRTFVVIGVESVLERNEIGRKLTLSPKRS